MTRRLLQRCNKSLSFIAKSNKIEIKKEQREDFSYRQDYEAFKKRLELTIILVFANKQVRNKLQDFVRSHLNQEVRLLKLDY